MSQIDLIVYIAVEGDVDESVLKILLTERNIVSGGTFGKKGKDYLRNQVMQYNNAAKLSQPWIVLVDLDQEKQCAPELITNWLPNPSSKMFLRVAVRSIEAWLLADRERIARFLSIPVRSIPNIPEHLDDPKLTMVNLARGSRSRAIQEDMVPRAESGRKIGPAYTSRLIEFIQDRQRGWRSNIASNNADSLKRCLKIIDQWAK